MNYTKRWLLMAKPYSPVNSATKKVEIKLTDDVWNITPVEELKPTKETFEQITKLAARGYTGRSIIYLMGVTEETFSIFRSENEEEVTEALARGSIIDEIECHQRLRGAATSTKSQNWLPALTLYGKIQFGWLGKGSATGNSDLPTGIEFLPVDIDDNDEDITE